STHTNYLAKLLKSAAELLSEEAGILPTLTKLSTHFELLSVSKTADFLSPERMFFPVLRPEPFGVNAEEAAHYTHRLRIRNKKLPKSLNILIEPLNSTTYSFRAAH
ncbi:MAG: hypothetical protein OQL05_06960, partial [Gammaproteobacteria bacterium]|nr:hypothetical protein [Gammaproteobacteria bacterium]MCW8927634.1 hypothetical protein [Gammaproteobacteria bacterium]MCW8973007.1 hypothetical protein [Gammaproteobacteria bacterium]MCW8992946.1 hypothetical protein [Gammaproteobacteria bacterium]MCW9088163.1 hypothetical protein [Gammaproteobacteria bacterium]